MAWTVDDQQVHKQQIVGGETSSSVGKDEGDDPKIHGSTYIENALQVGEPNRFEKMEGTTMLSNSREQSGEYALEVKDGAHFRGGQKDKGGFTDVPPPYSARFGEGDVTIDRDSSLINSNLLANTFVGLVGAGFVGTGSYINVQGWKGFDIEHPSKKGMRLRHVCMEGPEAGVYARGRISGGANVIHLPEYWRDLVDGESITVTLTPIGVSQSLFVQEIKWGNQVVIGTEGGTSIDCYYLVQGSRKDGEPLIPEYEGETPKDYPGDNTQYSLAGYNYDVRAGGDLDSLDNDRGGKK